MRAGRFLRSAAGVLGLVLGTAAIASGQPRPKAVDPAAGAMPDGAVARLGDSRLRHAGQPLCVAFTPDGKRVLSGGEDGVLRIWDAATGVPVSTVSFPDTYLRQIRYTHRESRLAIHLSSSRVRFLDPTTLKAVDEFVGELGPDMSISADGKLIAHVPAGVNVLRVSEIETGLEKLEVTNGFPHQFHADGKRFAVADDKGRVIVYQLAGGKPVMLLDNGGPLSTMAFSPDGTRLACGTGTEAKVWDVTETKNPKVVARIADAGHVNGWLDNDRLAAGDKTAIGVHALKSEQWVGRAKGVSGAWAVSPDGTRGASVTPGGLRVRVWDLTTGKQLHADNDTFPDTALITAAPDGKTVFVLAGDGAFRWSVGAGSATPAGTLPARAVVATTGKGRLAVVTPAAVLVYDDFDPTKPLPAKPSRTLEDSSACRCVAVSPDGTKVAYAGDGMRSVIADAATGKTIRVLPTQTVGQALAFTPDGEKLAMVARDGYLRLWAATDVGDGYDGDLWKVRIQRGPKGAVAVSADGRLIAASSSGLMKVVTAADGKEVFNVGNLFEYGLCQHCAFSPDSRMLLYGTDGPGGSVLVWEVATHSLVRRFSTGFGSVTRMGLFPDGSRVASAGAEEAITVWDVTTRHGKAEPKPDELLLAWGELDSLDAGKGYTAARTLFAGGARTPRVVIAGMDEIRDSHGKIERWVKDLASEEFADREVASKGLLEQGLRAMPAVQAAAAGAESAEARNRAAALLDKFNAKGLRVPENGMAGDMLRLFRAVQVLEDLGGSEVKPLLSRIADTAGPASDAAKAALKRIGK